MAQPQFAPGNYVAEVVQQGLGEASTGNSQFILQVKVLGPIDSEGGYSPLPNPKSRTIYRTITENTVKYFVEDLKALGFTGTSFAQLDPSAHGHQSFVGNQVDVYCEHRPDQNGGMKETWGISLGERKTEIKPASPAKIRQLDALFGKHLKTAAAVSSSAVKPPQPVPVGAGTLKNGQSNDAFEGMGITDDDVPF